MTGAAGAARAGDSGGDDTAGGADAAIAPGEGSGAMAGLTARTSVSVPLRLPNTTTLHAADYFDRNFSRNGPRKDPRGFLASPRPVSRCAICRKSSVVRWPAAISAII